MSALFFFYLNFTSLVRLGRETPSRPLISPSEGDFNAQTGLDCCNYFCLHRRERGSVQKPEPGFGRRHPNGYGTAKNPGGGARHNARASQAGHFSGGGEGSGHGR